MSTIDRRDFLKSGGLFATGMLLLPSCSPSVKEGASYRFFTNDEGACMVALCEQVIPAFDKFGGATEAGVIYYIDIQLNSTFKDLGSTYKENLAKLQHYCKVEFGKSFQNLSSDVQIEVMKKMEMNKVNADDWQNASSFFKLVRDHTMQGYYGSPIHGGNKDYMSFDMLRLEYPLNIGQNRYKKPLHKL